MIWYIIGFIIIISVILIVVAIKSPKKDSNESNNEPQASEPEIVTIHAEVIDMTCGTYTIGTKIPKMAKYFTVRLKKDDGEVFDLNVPEECYDGFEVGLLGNLSLVNGELNSFVPDEE